VAADQLSALLGALQAGGFAPIADGAGGWSSRCPVGGCGADDPAGVYRPLAIGPDGAMHCGSCGARRPDVERALRDGGWLTAGETGEWRATVRPCSEIPIRAARWLWAHRIPLGALALVAGQPGQGKSSLTCEIAARLSRGELPGDLHGQPSGSMIVSYEDAEATIAARLAAAGADLGRVGLLRMADGDLDRPPSLGDLERIDELLRDRGDVRLLVFDPLSAALTADVDSHRDADMRRALAGLAALAERHDLAAVAVTHLTKTGGEDVLARVLGARAWTAAARAVLVFGMPPDAEPGSPQRLLATAKSNLGPPQRSLGCEVETVEVVGADGELFEAPRVLIGGEVDAVASDLLVSRSESERGEREACADWLRDQLSGGEWVDVRQLLAEAAQAEFARATVYRAAGQVGVERRRSGYPAVAQWRLPASCLKPLETTDGATAETTGVLPANAGFLACEPPQLSQDTRLETTDGPADPERDLGAAAVARFGDGLGHDAEPPPEPLRIAPATGSAVWAALRAGHDWAAIDAARRRGAAS